MISSLLYDIVNSETRFRVRCVFQSWNAVLRKMPFETAAEPWPAASRRASGDSQTIYAASPPAAPTSQTPPDNLYATSIHTLVSAVLKLSRKTTIPRGRKAYRGLRSMKLGSEWFSPDERGARSGVELGFMSTTLNKRVALEYSGAARGGIGTVLEFEVGAVDCGARLDALSQYQGLKWTAPTSRLSRVPRNIRRDCSRTGRGCGERSRRANAD